MSKILAALAAAVLAGALVASALAAHTSTTKLVGTVGPGYTIGLTVAGKKVARLKAGSYTFVLQDKSSIHAWSLDGPHGFAKDLTQVPFVGTKSVTVTLKAGKYKFYCPSHETLMFGHFTVVQ